jgi:hypothetical protein
LFEAYVKCPTKCFLRSLGETGKGNAYADWVQTQTESFRIEGIKGLLAGAAHDGCLIGLPGTEDAKTAKWRLTADFVARVQNLESSLHAVREFR